MSETTMRLPSISDVDGPYEKLGLFMSDLDALVSGMREFVRDDVSLEDAVFMRRAGIATKERVRSVDPALAARLLVFANDLLDDVDIIRENAEALRKALLWAYRYHLLEPSGRYCTREVVDA